MTSIYDSDESGYIPSSTEDSVDHEHELRELLQRSFEEKNIEELIFWVKIFLNGKYVTEGFRIFVFIYILREICDERVPKEFYGISMEILKNIDDFSRSILEYLLFNSVENKDARMVNLLLTKIFPSRKIFDWISWKNMNGMSVFDVDTSEEVCATLFHQFDELNNNE